MLSDPARPSAPFNELRPFFHHGTSARLVQMTAVYICKNLFARAFVSHLTRYDARRGRRWRRGLGAGGRTVVRFCCGGRTKKQSSLSNSERVSLSLPLPCISGFRQISRPAAQRSPLVTSKTELDNCSRDLHRAVPHQMQIAERGGLPLGLVLCNISLGRMAT